MSHDTSALTPNDLEQLAQALNDKRPGVRHKAQALLLWHQDVPIKEIVRQVGVRSPQTLYNWLAAYRQGGIERLAGRPRSGRPPLATADYSQRLEAIIQRPPRDFDVDLDQWTAPALNAYLYAQTGLALSDARFRALLHRLGYRYERVRPKLPAEARLSNTPAAGRDWLNTIRAIPISMPTRAWQKVNHDR